MIDLDRLAELLLQLEAVGVATVIPEGDNLRVIPAVAIPADLLTQVKAHKKELLTALRPMFRSEPPPMDLDEVIDPPACPQCGRFEMWQTAMGNWRCLRCDPPKVAIRALERVQRIRRRLGMPSRPEAAAILADLRRLTAQAAHPCVAGEVVAA